MIGIYKIKNKLNGKYYIGQSTNIKRRWNAHKKEFLNKNSHTYDYPLYRAFRKYGLDNFEFSIIEECKKEELNSKERYWIGFYDSFFHGYNQTVGGDAKLTTKKEKIINIIHDLETTQLKHKEIALKNNISTEMVQGINTGRYWHYDRDYPIQKPKKIKKPDIKNEKTKTSNICPICGNLMDKNSTKCLACWTKELKEKAIQEKEEKGITREFLKNEIRKKPFTTIAKEQGVTDNAVRKWCKLFNLPYKSYNIRKYTDEEWKDI